VKDKISRKVISFCQYCCRNSPTIYQHYISQISLVWTDACLSHCLLERGNGVLANWTSFDIASSNRQPYVHGVHSFRVWKVTVFYLNTSVFLKLPAGYHIQKLGIRRSNNKCSTKTCFRVISNILFESNKNGMSTRGNDCNFGRDFIHWMKYLLYCLWVYFLWEERCSLSRHPLVQVLLSRFFFLSLDYRGLHPVHNFGVWEFHFEFRGYDVLWNEIASVHNVSAPQRMKLHVRVVVLWEKV
jgi:hypothetical protein